MLAYRVSKANDHFIRMKNGEVPPILEHTTYIVLPGGGRPGVVVTEPEFYRNYVIETRISRSKGRYVVQERS